MIELSVRAIAGGWDAALGPAPYDYATTVGVLVSVLVVPVVVIPLFTTRPTGIQVMQLATWAAAAFVAFLLALQV